MTPDEKSHLKSLLTQTDVLSLSVVVDQLPTIGLVPFVVPRRLDQALIHASGLAKHTRGLDDGAPFSVLIYQAGRPDLDPLQTPRVMLNGTVRVVEKHSSDYDHDREIYLKKFPSARPTFSLGDFNLYRLVFAGGRFVIGFGRTVNLKAETLTLMADEGNKT